MRKAGPAARAAIALVGFLSLAACGEEAPPKVLCLPEPTLTCVTQVAIDALAPVMADRAQRDFMALSADPMLDLAKAVNKVGDPQATAWMAHQAQLLPTGLFSSSTARVLAATGQRDAALALVKRTLAEDAEQFKTRMETGRIGWTPLSAYVGLLVDLGFPAEASALLKGWIERESPELAKLDAEKRAVYLRDAVLAFSLIGEAATAGRYAEQSTAALAELPEPDGTRFAAAGELAKVLLRSGMPDRAVAVLQKALAELAVLADRELAQTRSAELERLMLRAQHARKDDAGVAAARAALRVLRQKIIAVRDLASLESIDTYYYLMHDFTAALESGDRDEAQRIRDELVVRLPKVTKVEKSIEDAFSKAAEMMAVFGDDAGAIALVRRINDDPTDWKIPALIARMCRTLSDNGHIVAALRCAAHLTDRRPLYLQRRLETYAKIAADMAR